MTSAWIAHLLHSYGYYAVFALIALESLGIPLPGESSLIAAALYAGTTHHLNIAVLAGVAGAAAVLGDNAGYWIGKTGGQRLAERYGHYVRLDRAKLKVGRYLFARHGAKVVFFGRFVAVLRTYAAFFAGLSRMRWSRFLAANAAGGVLWVSVYAFGAYALGNAASGIGTTIGIIGMARHRRRVPRGDRGGPPIAALSGATSREGLPRQCAEPGPSHRLAYPAA